MHEITTNVTNNTSKSVLNNDIDKAFIQLQ